MLCGGDPAERGVRLDTTREEISRAKPDLPARALSRPRLLGEFNNYLSDPADKTQPLIGRQRELDRLIEILCRYSSKSPVLVGERGVGKRTIVGALARRMAEGDVPRPLAARSIVRFIPLLIESWTRIVPGRRGSIELWWRRPRRVRSFL